MSRALADFAVLAVVFAATTAIADALGAANLGTAMGIGQIAFAMALVALLVFRR
jgi:hypothetical protein